MMIKKILFISLGFIYLIFFLIAIHDKIIENGYITKTSCIAWLISSICAAVFALST